MIIFLSISAVIIFLIILILALPVHIILKKETEKEFYFDIKILFFSFADKDKSGKDTFDSFRELFKSKKPRDENKKEKKSPPLTDKISKYLKLFSDILSELFGLFRSLKINRLNLKIVSAGEDAAETALAYGRYCAVIYPIIGMIHSTAKINEKNENIQIVCNYTSEKPEFLIDTDISVRVFRILAALIRVGLNMIK